MITKFSGILTMDDKGNYILEGENGCYITYLLDKYISKPVGFVVTQNGRDYFNEVDVLYRFKFENWKEDYFLGGQNLGMLLWEHLSWQLDIFFDDDPNEHQYWEIARCKKFGWTDRKVRLNNVEVNKEHIKTKK